jgi:AgrD protein
MKRLAIIAASLLTLVAMLVSSSACMWGTYQPEEPKSLREG